VGGASQVGWGAHAQGNANRGCAESWGDGDWAVCVDVELARRAEVFIGNGYSSLSTQVVALRLGADGGRLENITLV
jgi:hypothetical protein